MLHISYSNYHSFGLENFPSFLPPVLTNTIPHASEQPADRWVLECLVHSAVSLQLIYCRIPYVSVTRLLRNTRSHRSKHKYEARRRASMNVVMVLQFLLCYLRPLRVFMILACRIHDSFPRR